MTIARAIIAALWPGKSCSRIKCPYSRPFDHPSGCGCPDCEMRRGSRLRFVCAAALLAVLIAVTGCGA